MPSTTDSAFSIYKPIPRSYKADAGTPIKKEPLTPARSSDKPEVDDHDGRERRKLKKHKAKDTGDSEQPKVKKVKRSKEEKAERKAAKEQAKVEAAREHEVEEEDNGMEFKIDIIEKVKGPEEGNVSEKGEDVVKSAKKAQSKFAKANETAQRFGDKELAQKYRALESKATKIVEQLCKGQRSGRNVTKNSSYKPPIHPSPSKSKKMIPKKEIPQLPLPTPNKEKETKKFNAEQDSKNTAELIEALATVPENKKARFWRMFAEKVELETKISASAQRLETLKNNLAGLQK